MHLASSIFSGDLKSLETQLASDPTLANADIPLGPNNIGAHPLHRLGDAVFNKQVSEETAVAMAKILIMHGSTVNPHQLAGKDSPLTAACAFHCDQLSLLYIDHGADIRHQGCHGGTALHWACWCGRDEVVKKLLTMNPDINQRCLDFKSTPLFWAIHGFRFGGESNLHHQEECARMLLSHGADRTIPNFEGYLPIELLRKETDHNLIDLLSP